MYSPNFYIVIVELINFIYDLLYEYIYRDIKHGDTMASIWINFTLHGERQFAEFGNTI